MPFIAMATGLEPPSTILLLPNPLATSVAPLPAIDRRRSQQESMLVSLGCDAFTNDEAAIIDRLGGSQNFEVAGREIAKIV
jgi:hypothetical protein